MLSVVDGCIAEEDKDCFDTGGYVLLFLLPYVDFIIDTIVDV